MDLTSVAEKYPNLVIESELKLNSLEFQQIILKFEKIVNKLNKLDNIVEKRWDKLKFSSDDHPITTKKVIEDDNSSYIFSGNEVISLLCINRDILNNLIKKKKLRYKKITEKKFAFNMDDVINYGLKKGILDESLLNK